MNNEVAVHLKVYNSFHPKMLCALKVSDCEILICHYFEYLWRGMHINTPFISSDIKRGFVHAG